MARSSVTATTKDGVMAFVGRKRKVGEVVTTSEGFEAMQENGLEEDLVKEKKQGSVTPLRPDVNVLGAGLVRKKLKMDVRYNGDGVAVDSERVGAPSATAVSGVNVLGPGLVRKKPKA